ncbi:MAG: sugar phosphate isomerase/epimerase [Planctomycetes bacterium]|jgi:sugar phosphate isomerase/epimerase|nr:sugar phosphate isomerase/epimerase [Planctomycetota bacterium]
MLSVSTSWNFERAGSLAAAARGLSDLGYRGVELRAQGAVPDLDSAGAACRGLRVRCRSVHAPLTAGPWSEGDPSREIASLDEARRRAAVESVLGTLPVAAAAGAEVIVVHLGEVAIEGARNRHREWFRAIDEGRPIAEDVTAALAERRAKRDPYLEAAARSLFELTRAESAVVFAVECRLYYHEIPALDEMELLLSDAGKRKVAYWHDAGHAHLLGRVGAADPLAWLARYGGRCAGLHLHDVIGTTDHYPPGPGEVDWAGLRAGAGAGMLRVMEVHGRHSAAELAAGAAHLHALGLD